MLPHYLVNHLVPYTGMFKKRVKRTYTHVCWRWREVSMLKSVYNTLLIQVTYVKLGVTIVNKGILNRQSRAERQNRTKLPVKLQIISTEHDCRM